ncbi:MAG: hypothetical protein NTW93_04050 [Phycisphaerae bacterium]|nr:hypothetical protein [Phycisphaerae bacterium]
MTIEFSLRRRATRSRYLAALWLSLSVIILIGTYISLPLVVNKTLSSIIQIEGQTSGINSSVTVDAHVQFLAIATLVLGLFAISFACFLLSRSAFVEIELAARFNGLADALCIAGNDFGQLEKVANLLMPKAKYLSVPEIFSTKTLSSVANVIKEARKTVS